MTASPSDCSTGAVSASGGGASDVSSTELGSGVGTACHTWPFQSYLELAALPTAAPRGRLHTKQMLWEWQLSQLAEDAGLLVSELLSNANKASWSPNHVGLVGLRLLADAQRLLIEVWDHNPDDPHPRPADNESESGRGFIVVQAIAHAWGYQRASGSLKVVRCELLTGLPEAVPIRARL